MRDDDTLNDQTPRVRLEELARKHGTDKVPNCAIYERYLASIRLDPVNFFEIGVGGYDDPRAGGSSIRMWKEYFPHGQIFALDIHDKSQHQEDRIKIYQGSQDDAGTLENIASEIGRIDVILDDGSHVSAHIVKAFETLFPLLAPGGLYIVEDIGTSYWTDHGGSEDFNHPDTSVSYFKRLVDGMQHPFFRHAYQPTYAETHARFVHFYPNIIILQKA